MNTVVVVFKIYLFYLFYFWLHWVFVAAHGLFPSCSEQGLLFVAVHVLLIVVASLVVAHGLSCSAAWGIFPDQLEPMSPALAGGFLTTAPPGKPSIHTSF